MQGKWSLISAFETLTVSLLGVALGRVLVIRMICQVESPKDMGPAASDTIAHPYHLSCVLC